jgi:hypothetical protein
MSDRFRTRLMGGFFAVGAACFAIAPLDAYATAVGSNGDAITFFIGSILFTLGGLTQCWLAMPERQRPGAGVGAWRAAWIQSAGTLLFNFMTFEAIGLAASSARYDLLVWSPNALGSICFLISGAFLYMSAPRRGYLPVRRHHGWWEPSINGLGCVLFGISAIAGYVITSTGEMLSVSTANWTTTFGAACFLAVAVPAIGRARSFKVVRLRHLREFEREVEADVERAERTVKLEVKHAEQGLARELVQGECAIEGDAERVLRGLD